MHVLSLIFHAHSIDGIHSICLVLTLHIYRVLCLNFSRCFCLYGCDDRYSLPRTTAYNRVRADRIDIYAHRIFSAFLVVLMKKLRDILKLSSMLGTTTDYSSDIDLAILLQTAAVVNTPTGPPTEWAFIAHCTSYSHPRETHRTEYPFVVYV